MTKVKICGITNIEDAQHAIECGADQIGFNFYIGSKRYISPADAGRIAHSLPLNVTRIGVFVNENIAEVVSISRSVGLNGIQLHGDEDQSYVDELRKRSKLFVIKALRLSKTTVAVDALDWNVDYVLFDSYSAAERGGTGIKLDWDELGTDIYLWFPYMAYLAGGLTPDNVGEAVRKSELLYAVDVASGVESSPGKKDPAKVEAFIKAVRNTATS